MTQQEQQQFRESLEAALSWIQDVQDRLKANDDTQGPRDALKVRLDETKVNSLINRNQCGSLTFYDHQIGNSCQF